MYYINLFLLSSVLGFVMETTLKTFFFHSMNNGIMYGPWIPVYGLGAVVIMLVSRTVHRKVSKSKFFQNVVIFFVVSILLTILEFIGGTLIEIFFHEVFWDYSKLKFNFGNYIALEISLLWGVCSLIFIYIIEPLLWKIIKKIPKCVAILVFILFIIDFVCSIISRLA